MQASETLFQERGSKGLVVLEILVENATGGAPTSDDVKAWIKAYGVTFPVIADPAESVFKTYVPQTVLPTFLVIGRDGVITYRGQGTTDDAAAEDKVKTAIDAALAVPATG
ncbi:MAG: hypothetical protein NVS3B10_28590 [Polyangiales bacterium]